MSIVTLALGLAGGLYVGREHRRLRRQLKAARDGLGIAIEELRGAGPPCGKPHPYRPLECFRLQDHQGPCAYLEDR